MKIKIDNFFTNITSFYKKEETLFLIKKEETFNLKTNIIKFEILYLF